MEWLNYHHLMYFWLAVREGGVAGAATRLRLTHPTVSAQIRTLERSLGEKLLEKKGRRLVPTDVGQVVLGYADEIFSLGSELKDAVRSRATTRPMRLVVGIADVVPKVVARRLLEPALAMGDSVRIVCHEDKPEQLLADLAQHELDVVLTDAPVSPSAGVRAYNHLLGESSVTFVGTPKLAKAWRRGFPGSLDGAPLLLPTENTALRRSLDAWFAARGIRPRIVAEFEDSALLAIFGRDGAGLFAVPTAIEQGVRAQYAVQRVGRADGVRERFYAVSAERRLRHPAVVAICDAARNEVFA